MLNNQEAVNRIEEILREVDELGIEAQELMFAHFRSRANKSNAVTPDGFTMRHHQHLQIYLTGYREAKSMIKQPK
tara:strand:+ start:589 stop:813 length:225 start_codon:yes stop_codon:yes gene_type:complete